MLDTTDLTVAVDRFADRLRAAPQSRLQRGAASEGLALARDLAARAQRIEAPEGEPLIIPEVGPFAVADQLTVAGRDLAEALRSVPPGATAQLDEAVDLVRAAQERAAL